MAHINDLTAIYQHECERLRKLDPMDDLDTYEEVEQDVRKAWNELNVAWLKLTVGV